jgi:threonyl-tRNA synthetase
VDEEIKRGYKHVITPDIAKLDLYKKSGHYPYYKDTMYSPIDIDGEEFMLRPMTCPHHYELYLSKPHSYRELPMRIAEMAKLYRYEASGNLAGLVRVRSFCLADAHIICANNEQASSEILQALELISYVAGVFGLKKGEDFWYRLSLGSRKDDNKKYFKDDAAWENAEGILRNVLKSQDVRFYEAEDEAAFYGPKVDVQMKDKRGQENTAFTVQYDFLGAGRFNLTYTDSDGTEKLASAVIHRSSIGAIERIMAFLIEHFEGAFPLWLSPIQARVLPVSEKHLEYARKIHSQLIESGIRSDIDESNETLGKKVRETKVEKIPYWIVVGDKEIEAEKVTLESRNNGQLGQMTYSEFLGKLQEEIKHKTI